MDKGNKYTINISGSGPTFVGDFQKINIGMRTSGKYHNNLTNIETNFFGIGLRWKQQCTPLLTFINMCFRFSPEMNRRNLKATKTSQSVKEIIQQ